MKKSIQKLLTTLLAVTLVAASAGCAKTPASSAGGPASSAGSAEKHSFTAMVTETTNEFLKFADRDRYVAWQALEKMFAAKGLDITFDIVQEDQYATTITTSLASANDLAEYVSCDGLDDAAMIACIENGTFLPINDFIEKGDGTAKAFLAKHNFAVKKTAYVDGKMYWMPAIQETYYNGKPAGTCINMLIRNDWVTKLGIEVPDTLDEFTAYLKACQEKDLNGNGKKDEYYVQRLRDFSTGIEQWFGLPNSRFGLNSKGQVLSTWEMDGVKDFFRYIQMLLKEGLISQDYIACESAVTDAANANNQAAALSSYAMEAWLEPAIKNNVPAGAKDPLYITMMPIQGKAGIDPVSDIESPQLADWYRTAFTKNLKDQKAASIFLDILYSDEFAELSAWGIEGVTYEVKNGFKVAIGDAGNSNWEAASLSGICSGGSIWSNNVFPRLRFSDMESEINGLDPVKGDAQKAVINFPNTVYHSMKNQMSTPTAEEATVLEKYETNFQSLSREIAVKIYKGEIDIDKDWDSQVIQPLKASGMKELFDVYQARADRFFK